MRIRRGRASAIEMREDNEIEEGIRWDGDGGGVLDADQARKGECDRDGEVVCGDWEGADDGVDEEEAREGEVSRRIFVGKHGQALKIRICIKLFPKK